MEARIQYRGHCPHCGRQQAVNDGMAKHGYTVDWGYFHGTCAGAGLPPIEQYPQGATVWAARLREISDRKADEALKYEQGELEPEGMRQRYSEFGRRKVRIIPYAELNDRQKRECRAITAGEARHVSKELRALADYLDRLVAEVGGQPLLEVKLNDPSKAIAVGDRVKVAGREVVVAAIENRRAQGVGPGINGRYVDHVIWQDGDKRRAYPKRYARKVVA